MEFTPFTIYNNVKKTDIDKPINIPKFYTVEYQIQNITNKIDNIDSFTDDEIKDIIVRQHSMILNYDLFLSNTKTRLDAQKLFTNKRFLSNFVAVIKLLRLDHHEIICLNKLAYDYYILPDKDKEISDLLYKLTTDVNYILVSIYSGIIGLNAGQVLAMIKNSSFKNDKVIHRVNNFLVKSNIELSVQNAVDIICHTYERFGSVFIHSMMEIKTPDMTPEQIQKFDNISLALLEIANSLTIEDIKKIIYDYHFILTMANTSTKFVRFSLKTANGYPRIIKAIKELEITDNITIP